MSIVFLESPSYDPHFNLALEQYVFDELPKSNTYFMLWQNNHAIIVGKYQNTIEEINLDFVRENHIHVVRRLSGGGAVYHDLGNINFTFVMDAGKLDDLDMLVFIKPVIKVLTRFGVIAEQNGRNDITIDGKKFSGNSQYIKDGRIMHHGTLLFDSDLNRITSALKVSKDKIESKGFKSVRSRITNLKPYFPSDMTMSEFKYILKEYMFEEIECSYELNSFDLKRVEDIKSKRYATWDWNFGYSPNYRIKKERLLSNCGKIQLNFEIEEGYITKFAMMGDFFGSGDLNELTHVIIGRKCEEKELKHTLQDIDINFYCKNLTAEDLIHIILQ